MWTYEQIAAYTGLSVDALKMRRSRGQLPEPDFNPNARVVGWEQETIENWWKEEQNETG